MNLEKITVESAKKDSSVHFFPCEIKYNGVAEVDWYFNTSIKECKGEDGEGRLQLKYIMVHDVIQQSTSSS